ASGVAEEAYHFVGQIWLVAVAQQYYQVQCVLEGATDRTVVHRAAPDQPICLVYCITHPDHGFWRVLSSRVVHGKSELLNVEKFSSRPGLGRSFQRNPQCGQAGGTLCEGSTQADNFQLILCHTFPPFVSLTAGKLTVTTLLLVRPQPLFPWDREGGISKVAFSNAEVKSISTK